MMKRNAEQVRSEVVMTETEVRSSSRQEKLKVNDASRWPNGMEPENVKTGIAEWMGY